MYQYDQYDYCCCVLGFFTIGGDIFHNFLIYIEYRANPPIIIKRNDIANPPDIAHPNKNIGIPIYFIRNGNI